MVCFPQTVLQIISVLTSVKDMATPFLTRRVFRREGAVYCYNN